MTQTDGRNARQTEVRELMERKSLDAVLLSRPPNFAWYTGGGDNRVDHTSPAGVADVVVTRDRWYVFTNNIEAARMRQEQTPGCEVVEYRWYANPREALRDATGGGRLGTDGQFSDDPQVVDVAPEVSRLRRRLDLAAQQQYRTVGAETVAAMAEAAASLQPGVTEDEAAALLLLACRRRGLFAPVLMAAGDDRILRYRHPVPVGIRCDRRVMLVVCAERWGLYANLTHFVHFEEPDTELRRRLEACRTILDRMRDEATRPGRTLAEAFQDCRRFYADAGFSDEWRLHHQGGSTGYATREVIATPDTGDVIEAGQAFAWNPSISGAKAEETFILTGSGPEVVASGP